MHHMEHIWAMVMLKICKHTFFAYLSQIDAIYAFYPESFSDNNLTIRKVFVFFWLWMRMTLSTSKQTCGSTEDCQPSSCAGSRWKSATDNLPTFIMRRSRWGLWWFVICWKIQTFWKGLKVVPLWLLLQLVCDPDNDDNDHDGDHGYHGDGHGDHGSPVGKTWERSNDGSGQLFVSDGRQQILLHCHCKSEFFMDLFAFGTIPSLLPSYSKYFQTEDARFRFCS